MIVQVVKFRDSNPTAPSPNGQEHPAPSPTVPEPSLPCRLTVDQLLTSFHQRALLNQFQSCRKVSGRETCEFSTTVIIQISLKAHHAEHRTADPSTSVA